MGTLNLKDRTFGYLWASDIAYEGIRLEIWDQGKVLFDISRPTGEGVSMVNTFGNEVNAELIAAAVQLAQRHR